MESPLTFIQKAFLGTDLSNDDLQTIFGLYALVINKDLLEALVAFKGKDEKFLHDLSVFFNQQISSLPEHQIKLLQETINARKNQILTEIILSTIDTFPAETKNKVLINLHELSGHKDT